MNTCSLFFLIYPDRSAFLAYTTDGSIPENPNQTATIFRIGRRVSGKWSHIVQLLEDEGLNAEFSKIIHIAAEDIRYDVEKSINLALDRSKRLKSFKMTMAIIRVPISTWMSAVAKIVRAKIIH